MQVLKRVFYLILSKEERLKELGNFATDFQILTIFFQTGLKQPQTPMIYGGW